MTSPESGHILNPVTQLTQNLWPADVTDWWQTHPPGCLLIVPLLLLLLVLLQVFLQQPWTVEAFPTQSAGVWFDSGVDPDMVPEGRGRGEDLVTECTRQRFGLLVGVLVVAEARSGGEAFGADHAGERSLARVPALVLHQVTALEEAPPTDTTAVGLLCAMGEAMAPQASLLSKSDAAVRAGVRLLPGVDALVHHHIYPLGETFPTHRTHVAFFSPMHGHVVSQP